MSFAKKSFQSGLGQIIFVANRLGCPTEICGVEGKPSVIGLKFQVADVHKPVVSFKRIVENGNIVRFGPADGDNYIEN